MEDVKLKNWAIFKFLKNGREGKYTKIFDNLSNEEKNIWINLIPLTSELPVFVHSQDANWLLVTTKRILWHENGEFAELALSEIARYKVNMQKFIEEGGRPGKVNNIEIETTTDETILLHCEGGFPHTGLYSALNILAMKN